MQNYTNLREYDPSNWKGTTSKEHLGTIGSINPQMAMEHVTLLYNANFGTNFRTFLKQFPVKKLENDTDFRWMLQGSTRRNYPVKAVYTDSGSAPAGVDDRLGSGYNNFGLEFEEKAFSPGDIIVGEKTSLYPVRVIEEIENGGGYLYICSLMLGDPDAYIPYEEVSAGKKWSLDFNAVESSFSDRGGEIDFTSPFSMRNTFGHIRKQHKVAGNMAHDKSKSAFSWKKKDKNGKEVIHTTWMENSTWEFEQQFQQDIDNMLNFSRSNKTADGTYQQKGFSGEVIKTTSGIEEQMWAGNTSYYTATNNLDGTDLDIKFLTESIMDISDNNRKYGDKRNIMMRTGKWGAYQFNFAIKNLASLYTPLTDSDRIARSKEFGFIYRDGFSEYYAPDGTILSVYVDPTFDDDVRNKEMHPSGRGLLKSYQYDILNVGEDAGTPNIQLYEPNTGAETMKYIPGLRCPYDAPAAFSAIATAQDMYELHRMYAGGTAIVDPGRTLSLIAQ